MLHKILNTSKNFIYIYLYTDLFRISHVQSSWEPMVINDLVLSFPWHNISSLETNKNTLHHIVLEGGAAFGTGDHPTTRLCIKWLQNHQKDIQNKCILDYGCGSAILALVGLSYGMNYAMGVDIDIDSLISAKGNCVMNNKTLDFVIADETDLDTDEEKSIVLNKFKGKNEQNEDTQFLKINDIPNHYFDITVANILAPILIQLAPKLAQYTSNNNGKIVLSGILNSQADRVISVYNEYFDDMSVYDEEGDWVVITGTKKKSNQN